MSARRIIRGAIAAIALAFTVAHGATRDEFLYGNAADGSNLPFRYFVPPGYDGGQVYPLILFLHGAGERGNDNEAQLNNNANGAMRLLDDGNLALQPVFMIAPQCPTDGWWSGATLTSAIGIVDQISATYNIDPDRVYVTGLSMGGMGTWSAVVAEPDRFAAAVPMCGIPRPFTNRHNSAFLLRSIAARRLSVDFSTLLPSPSRLSRFSR